MGGPASDLSRFANTTQPIASEKLFKQMRDVQPGLFILLNPAH